MDLLTYVTSTIHTKAYRLLRERVNDVLSQYDLTPSYWSMLGIIAKARDGIRQVEIAQIMHVKAPLVTAMAHKLQDRDLIHRVSNQFDARAKLLALTPEGKKFSRTVEVEIHKNLDPLLSGLTEADLMTYQKVLSTIIANDKSRQDQTKKRN